MSGSNPLSSVEDKIDALFNTEQGNGADSSTGAEGSDTSTAEQTANNQTGEHGQRAAEQQDTLQGGGGAANNRAGGAAGNDARQRPVRQAPNGDLLDAQGNVVVKGGAERRHYETAQRATRELRTVQEQLSTVQRELETYKQATTLHKQLGLEPADVTTALHFMAHFRKDPIEAARKILADLKAAGYNIDEVSNGVDVSAIKKLVEDTIAPFKQDREAQQREHDMRSAVQREIEETFAEFPWAEIQQNELAAVSDMYPNEPLRMIALRVRAWAAENGFDINQPLAPQVQARRAGNTAGTQANNARSPARTGAAPNATQRQAVTADVRRSNRDIVREVLREHGVDVE